MSSLGGWALAFYMGLPSTCNSNPDFRVPLTTFKGFPQGLTEGTFQKYL